MPADPAPIIAIPPGWKRRRVRPAGVLLELRAGAPPTSGLAPIVRVFDAAATTLDLTATQRRIADDLAAGATKPDLEDLDIHDLAGHDVGYLRLAHRENNRELITETWCWVIGEVAWVVSATMDCGDYLDYCDLIEDIVYSFEPPEFPLAG